MFGPVASEATVWRTFNRIGPAELAGIDAARRDARARAWAAGAGPTGEGLIVDIDSTLVTTKADKQDAAPTYKRSYGHHPLLAMIAETGEMVVKDDAGEMKSLMADPKSGVDVKMLKEGDKVSVESDANGVVKSLEVSN